MTRSRLLVAGLAAVVMLAGTPVVVRAATARRPQTLVLDAVFTRVQSAGPGPERVGHRQIVSGSLKSAEGRRLGSFSFTCIWTAVSPAGARESCHAAARTADGEMDGAGTSESDSLTQAWRITGGTGAYRRAAGSIFVRDLGEREALITASVRPHGDVVLRAGRENRPLADQAFTVRANRLCRSAAAQLATLPPFPLANFDPLHPDPASLPSVGAFFTGPGDPRPVLGALDSQLKGLRHPIADGAGWRAVLGARARELSVIADQDRAALAGNVPAFVHSVHASSASFRQVAITATVFGVTDCVL